MQVRFEIKEDLSTDEIEELLTLGHFLEKDIVFRRDHESALKCYELAAKYNNADAFNRIGWLYGCGIGIKQDIKRAVSYFKKAIKLNHPIAMVNLGKFYEQGLIGEEPDFLKSCKYYKMAAGLGEPKGLFNYGNCLHYGLGTPKNMEAAFKIFKDLVDVDFTEAYFYLGMYYENGYVVEKDIELAREYYRQGALRGDAYCYNELGRMYATGVGVNIDNFAALDYYKQAAELGDELGYTNMAFLYENGDLGEPDIKKAIELYEKAAKRGEPNAIDALDRLKGWFI